MNTQSEENYLKAVYKLSEGKNDNISTNAIANELSTTPGSVTDMLQRLSGKKLINYTKYKGVSLKPEGKRIAVAIIRKHRLWEYFLVEKLDFPWVRTKRCISAKSHKMKPWPSAGRQLMGANPMRMTLAPCSRSLYPSNWLAWPTTPV